MSSSNLVVREATSATPESGVYCPTALVPSFAHVYNTYFDFVWSTARYLGVELGDIDDVVQEVFFTIYGRLNTIERPESLRSWIYGVVRRIASKYHRNKRTRLIETRTERIEPEMLEPEWRTPQHMAEQHEQAKLLWSLLEKLDASKREVFVLAELEEMTAPEIADAVGVPLNTVYSRLRAARQELEEALQRTRARSGLRGE